MALRERVKWFLFPGLNLHARLRWRVLPRYFGKASDDQVRRVLDAGCGNGMLSYQSSLRGNRVIGISIKEGEVQRCRQLFNDFLGVDEDRLSFRVHNLYELDALGLEFDEIICSEVLEHIRDDEKVCRSFWEVLKPGGILHLCCPNAAHPDNIAHECDKDEAGGHVRAGYTLDTYRALLEPMGFEVSEAVGLGGPVRQAFNKRMIRMEEKAGFLPGFVLFLLALPVLWLDGSKPRIPYSLYVRAVKKESPASSSG